MPGFNPGSGKKKRNPPRQATIHQWLSIRITLVVVATVLLGGTIAIILILNQINVQVRSRLEAAQSSSMALLTAEQDKLLKFTQLVSVRPTLCSLLQLNNKKELETYLEELRINSDTDYLIVINDKSQVYSSGVYSFDLPASFQNEHPIPMVDITVLDDPTSAIIYSISNIIPQQNCAISVAGQVISIEMLDDGFLQQLSADTGVELSLITNEHYTASSLPWGSWMDQPVQPEPANTIAIRKMCSTPAPCYEEPYYFENTPILDSSSNEIAYLESAFPAEPIRRQTITLIFILTITAVIVAGASTLISLQFTRRVSSSLSTLSDAAERMGAGNLDTPVPVGSGWIGIDRLANQLENSRRNLQQIQKITRRGLVRFVHLIGAIREGMMTVNPEGLITWVNQDACRILGYDYSNLVRRDISEIFRKSPGERSNIQDALRMAEEKNVPITFSLINGNDEKIFLNISNSMLDIGEDESNEGINEHVMIFRESSEEGAFNRMQSEFLANVAHEFRTPLSTISASIELLCEEGSNMSQEELDQLKQSSRMGILHLQTLVDNLLEKATIEAGVFHLRIQELDIPDELSNLSNLMAPLLDRKQQHLVVSTEGDLSNASGDPVRLVQALVNLVQNASKFSPDGTDIHMDVSIEGEVISFSVSDSGEGLPTDHFDQLFDRFFTGDRSRGSQYGIGLGLQIVKSIAEAHGGTVGAENLAGGGAKVWFTIYSRQNTVEGGAA